MALCSGSAAIEAFVLVLLGFRSGFGLAPQVSAPAPIGLFHDLRWLVVYQNSWWSFGLELAAVLVLRGALTAVMVREAWPRHVGLPSWRTLLVRSLGFNLLATLLLAPWTILLFGLAVVSVSWLFFAAVPSVLVLSLLLSHGAISHDWWRRSPAPRAVGWLALSFLVASAASAVISLAPDALVVPVSALTGLYNAWAWCRIVQLVAARSPARRFAPVAPAGIVAFLAVVVVGSFIGFASVANPSGASASAGPDQVAPAAGNGTPVLVASGFWSSWDGRSQPTLRGNYLVRRFSYRGLGPNGAPLPYRSADTQKPLGQLDQLMSEQVRALEQRTHRRVAIVAESEGSLVAKTYLESAAGLAPVDALVMVSPLITPGRVYYPPTGESGWGVAAGVGLRGISDTISTMTSVDLGPQEPLLRSIVDNGPLLRTVLDCPLNGVRQLVVMPLADAVAAPTNGSLTLPSIVVPAFHGGMLGDPTAQEAISQALSGSLPPSSAWSVAEDIIRPAAAAWQVPNLQASLNPAWELGGSEGGDGLPSCEQIRAQLSTRLAGPLSPR